MDEGTLFYIRLAEYYGSEQQYRLFRGKNHVSFISLIKYMKHRLITTCPNIRYLSTLA